MDIRHLALTILVATTLAFTVGCGEKAETHDHTASKERSSQNPHSDGVYGDMVMLHTATADSMNVATGDTVYTCPMSCIPPRTEAGNCPVCGMRLDAKTAHVQGDLQKPGMPMNDTSDHAGHSH